MSSGLSRGAQAPITCPNCGHKIRKTVGQLERINHIACTGCGQNIEIHGSAGAVKEVDDAIKQLKRNFAKIKRRKGFR